ncbi:ExbD/TolR family protein [Hymenobacter endophyticus]|uniref:Biopolymer transporter ExbD n=1 Tax=Hymenobacter endophyticus TaxID=3076335 RepID=A0ABU3TEM2_9BACT|nr:biopolymer transporter ExbD [Hymenobacter endophyticus]MDU0369794.1 biopolymer transporter ExbD [Hymenobacter endophyticus]
MANLQTAAPAARGTKPRVKKHAFHLDMTPMVDLAFLLLTFFMLTTTFSKPTIMEVAMPDPKGKTDVPASGAMTVLLDKNHTVHYFYGLNSEAEPAQLHTTSFGAGGLRQALLSFRPKNGMVLIKASDKAAYQSMVDALDEMNITNTKKYALVDINPADEHLLAQVR